MEGETSKLTDKEKLFVKAYVGEARLNASRAARIAGYKDPEQSGWINKRKVEIRAAIDAELEKNGLGKNEVIARMAREARRQGSFEDILTVDKRGRARIDWKKAEERGVIDCFESVDMKVGKIKLLDPKPALMWFGKAYGLDGTLGTKENPVHIEQTFLTQGQLNQALRDAIDAAKGEAGLSDGKEEDSQD